MPRSKKTESTVKRTKKTSAEKQAHASAHESRFASLNLHKSYTSLIYGVITVIVIFALIFAGVRNFTHRNLTPDIAKDGLQTVNEDRTQSVTYTVQEGDTLWSIAEQTYQDGFQWELIAKANNVTEPYTIEKGTKLSLPERTESLAAGQAQVSPTQAPTVTTVQPTPTVQASVAGTTTKGGMPIGGVAPASQSDMSSITEGSYTVQHGDNLWNIAVRAYGDGYKWSEIARANNLINPGIIHTGNVLTLPR